MRLFLRASPVRGVRGAGAAAGAAGAFAGGVGLRAPDRVAPSALPVARFGARFEAPPVPPGRPSLRGFSAAVYAWGRGAYGSLGLPPASPPSSSSPAVCLDARAPERVPGLPDDVISVCAGHYASFAVDGDGRLWSWGRPDEGVLGRGVADGEGLGGAEGAAPAPSYLPGLVEGLPPVRVASVAASGVVALAALEDGSVWSWGASKRGALGQGPGVARSARPGRVAFPRGRAIAQVSAGWGHALALAASGEAFSWGWPADGRLGRACPADADAADAGPAGVARREARMHALCDWEPREVEALRGLGVARLACGNDHSLALAGDGRVFAFGDDSLGALGAGGGAEEAAERERKREEERERGSRGRAPCAPSPLVAVPLPSPIATIAAGLGHSLALDARGRLWAWGWDAAGQLGRGGGAAPSATSEARRPCRVDAWGRIRTGGGRPRPLLAAGRAHSLAAGCEEEDEEEGQGGEGLRASRPFSTSSLACLAWGAADNGRLGTGEVVDSPCPEPIPELDGRTILGLAAGWDHSLALVREGEAEGDA